MLLLLLFFRGFSSLGANSPLPPPPQQFPYHKWTASTLFQSSPSQTLTVLRVKGHTIAPASKAYIFILSSSINMSACVRKLKPGQKQIKYTENYLIERGEMKASHLFYFIYRWQANSIHQLSLLTTKTKIKVQNVAISILVVWNFKK